jgi:hypothetical protein
MEDLGDAQPLFGARGRLGISRFRAGRLRMGRLRIGRLRAGARRFDDAVLRNDQ